MAASYKAAKEAFVSDNLGSSIHTINAVSAVGLVSPLFLLEATVRPGSTG